MKKSSKPEKLPAVPLPVRMQGEPERFYKRFLAYCLATGINRSVEAVWKAEEAKTGPKGKSGKSGKKPGSAKPSAPGSWYKAAAAFCWADRSSYYDAAVAYVEAQELAAMRKKAREERAALVSKFVASASALLADPTILANAPAGTSAAVLRAVEASRREFGADLLPEDVQTAANWKSGGNSKFPNQSQTPNVEVFIDMGDGTRGKLSDQPPADEYDPANDFPEDESSADTPSDQVVAAP